MQQVKVGFLSCHNYFDRNAWSGTVYRMYDALKSVDLQMVNLGSPKKPTLLRKFVNRVSTKKTPPEVGSSSYIEESKKKVAHIQEQLNKTPCDVIFGPVASLEITYLDTNIPIIYLSDITFNLYNGYYPSNFDQQQIEWISQIESTAISKASQIVYPSDWAAQSAIDDYYAEATKVKVIPFGANLDDPPAAEEVSLSKKTTSSCRLLFIGKDWERKGGEIAFQTLISLHKMGVDAELIVLGSVPPAEIQHDKLTLIPFLDKNDPIQRQQFRELFLQSNFFIFPTRADCSPIVTCEANAFGLPVITTDVGGLPTIINQGKNGYMLPLSASGDDFAKLIAEIFCDQTKYEQLVHSSREEYDSRLNWHSWAQSIRNLITDMI
ncbi:MAG: glycosyltransferase family 4 protein [Symploca sp. SIO2G7]|nr:glycosyltransferase family 4 protein [Symploca sp. SIO2G7]